MFKRFYREELIGDRKSEIRELCVGVCGCIRGHATAQSIVESRDSPSPSSPRGMEILLNGLVALNFSRNPATHTSLHRLQGNFFQFQEPPTTFAEG
jgi:hypothetical protein